MQISPDQQVTLDNFKAHVSVLREELQSVSEALDSTLSLKKIASKELDDICASKIRVQQEINELMNGYEEKKLFITNSEKSLTEREEKLAKSISLFEEEKGLRESEIATLNNKFETEYSEKILLLRELDSNVEKTKDNLVSLTNKVMVCEDDLRKAIEEKTRALKFIAESEQAMDEKTSVNKKILNDLEKKIKEATIELENTTGQTAIQWTSLKKAKSAFDIEFSDFQVIKKRFIKQASKEFPNIPLKL